MLSKYFNLALIVLYLFCGYTHLAGYPYINSAKDVTFVPVKNIPGKTHYFTIAVSKHYQNVNHSQNTESGNTPAGDKHFYRAYSLSGIFFLSDKPLTRFYTRFLNKAPPLS